MSEVEARNEAFEVLERLAVIGRRLARVVELRYYGSTARWVGEAYKSGIPGADPQISYSAGATAFLSGDLDVGGG